MVTLKQILRKCGNIVERWRAKMSTQQQRVTAFQVTRVLIFIFGSLAIYLDEPIGDILGVISLAMWLWMPKLIQFELNVVDKFKGRHNV